MLYWNSGRCKRSSPLPMQSPCFVFFHAEQRLPPSVILSDASARRIYAQRFDREALPSGRHERSEGSPRSDSISMVRSRPIRMTNTHLRNELVAAAGEQRQSSKSLRVDPSLRQPPLRMTDRGQWTGRSTLVATALPSGSSFSCDPERRLPPSVILSDASARRIYAQRFDREALPSGRPERSEGSPRGDSMLLVSSPDEFATTAFAASAWCHWKRIASRRSFASAASAQD